MLPLNSSPEHNDFDFKMQVSELQLLHSNQVDQQAMAENFVGLPYWLNNGTPKNLFTINESEAKWLILRKLVKCLIFLKEWST